MLSKAKPIQMVLMERAGESGAVKAVVQRQKAEAAVEGMSADQKIGKNAASPGAVLSSMPATYCWNAKSQEEDPPFKIRKVGHP